MKSLDSKALTVAALFAVALAVCWLGYQQNQIADDAQQAVVAAQDAAAAPTPTVRERVVQLPEDGGRYHTILLLHSNWRDLQEDRELVARFKSDPLLVNLTAQTHYWEIAQGDPLFSRYATDRTILPAVMILTENGRAVYNVSSPLEPTQVTADVEVLFASRPWLPWRKKHNTPCPCPNPSPDVKPEPPKPDTKIDVNVPIVKPPAEVAKTGQGPDFWVILAVCIVASAGVAIVAHLRSRLS